MAVRIHVLCLLQTSVDFECICQCVPLHVSVGIYGHGTVRVWACARDVPLVFVWEIKNGLKQG